MSSRPKAERRRHAARAEGTVRALAAAVAFGTLLAGCSNPGLYLDRRDSIALDGGDALAANKITQMYDPWPPHSGNTNIPYNGEKAASAVERYRTNKVTQPVDPMGLQTSSQSPPTLQSGGSQNNNSGANAAAAASGGSTSGVSTAGQ